MNLDEKIATKVELKYRELVELFQDSDRTDADLRRSISYLMEAVPLLQDVKTEVADIAKLVRYIPQSKEEDEDEDEPRRNDRPYTPDPDSPDVRELGEKIEEEVNRIEYIQNYLENNNFNNLPDTIIKRIPFLEIIKTAVDLTYRLKKYSDIIGENIANKANRQIEKSESVMETIINNAKEDLQTLERLIDQAQSDLNDAIDRLQGQQSEDHMTTLEKLLEIFNVDTSIKEDTEIIIDDVGGVKQDTTDIKDNLSNMDDNMTQCCSSMSDGISSVKDDTEDILTGLGQLKPSTQANQSLALMQKMNAALGGLEHIRGLL